MCGVVSWWATFCIGQVQDSPHVRGCILNSEITPMFLTGFPACAGLYLNDAASRAQKTWIPRMCGVVSRKHKLYTLLKENPPHMRGCIYKKANMITGKKEFPACAGLHRKVNVSW